MRKVSQAQHDGHADPVLTEYEKEHIGERQPLPERYLGLSDEEMDAPHRRRQSARSAAALVILGHHYQRDEVIKFADYIGDSFKLARQVGKHPDAEFIVFCGVHFMAESADVLQRAASAGDPAGPRRRLLDGRHGRSRSARDVLERARSRWGVDGRAVVVPVTYINSAASIKAFVGEHGGVVCTSSNAAATLKWAWERGEQILFLPDQHLGRNTAYKMGVPLDRDGGVGSERDLGRPRRRTRCSAARIILWKGHCSVHTRFTVAADRAHPRAASRRPRHRASRSAVGRRAGGRRLADRPNTSSRR